jgi:hypothetical protein
MLNCRVERPSSTKETSALRTARACGRLSGTELFAMDYSTTEEFHNSSFVGVAYCDISETKGGTCCTIIEFERRDVPAAGKKGTKG